MLHEGECIPSDQCPGESMFSEICFIPMNLYLCECESEMLYIAQV